MSSTVWSCLYIESKEVDLIEIEKKIMVAEAGESRR
jgi:hypothetical protein